MIEQVVCVITFLIRVIIFFKMPYSFTKIEKEKTQKIWFVFSFLILFYFISFLMVYYVSINAVQYLIAVRDPYFTFVPIRLKFSVVVLIFLFSFLVGVSHWMYTTSNIVERMLKILRAEPLKKTDSYHQRFRNIVDEVCIATGGEKIEAVVLPVMAMNAFALADFEGRNVIGVTEGLLARLNRAQLEAVVGHEAAHIVSGDCLTTTVTSSIFELYNAVLKSLEIFLKGGQTSRYSYAYHRQSGFLILLVLIYGLLCIVRFASNLLRMFISRESEYRADAIAVRLTRDPLSLADALYSITYHWRGAGLAAQEMSSIFIVPPAWSDFSEGEGFFQDLFSTHPPTKKRLGVLLNIAHTEAKVLEQNFQKSLHKPRVSAEGVRITGTRWMANHNGQWEGPFETAQMLTLGWFDPDTWVKKIGQDNIFPAVKEKEIAQALTRGKSAIGIYSCPKCQVPLEKIHYEGVTIHKCPTCQGTLVHSDDVTRIILREEVGFDEKIRAIAKVIKEQDTYWRDAKIKRDQKSLLTCPKCQHPRSKMLRTFYTAAYKVEIDKCLYCNFIWFDRDELEVLQYLVEEANAQNDLGISQD